MIEQLREMSFWAVVGLLIAVVGLATLLFIFFLLAKVVAYGYQAGKRRFELENPNPEDSHNGRKTGP